MILARLLASVVALLVPFGALVAWILATHVHPGPVRALEVPRQVGPWRAARDDSFTDDVVRRAGVDAYLLRRYEAPGRTPIWLYVGAYAAQRANGGKYHDPANCYPGSGWEILDYRPLAIPLAGADALAAQAMELERAGQRQLVNYWFQPAGRWPRTRAAEELLRVFDAARGAPQYAFVRLSGPLAADAARDLAEFAAQIALPVRAAVETLREPAPERIADAR